MRLDAVGVVAAVLSGAVCACSSGEPSQAAEGIGSWGATAQMVARRWTEHSIPSAFATRALESVAQELTSQSDAVRTMPMQPDTRAMLLRAAAEMKRAVAAIDSGITRSDPVKVRARLDDLDRQRGALAALDSALTRRAQ